jgi:hypothetical protein
MSGPSLVFQLFKALAHGHKNMLLDTQVCFRVSPVYTSCTILCPLDDNAHYTLRTQQCKTITTLSDHKGKQIPRDTTHKCFLHDFRTMFAAGAISTLYSIKWKWEHIHK